VYKSKVAIVEIVEIHPLGLLRDIVSDDYDYDDYDYNDDDEDSDF
jgi:hypothetical protein